MLTGTHLLQSCGIVLCEIETAEHQERLFEINFKCFNSANTHTFTHTHNAALLHHRSQHAVPSPPPPPRLISLCLSFISLRLRCFSLFVLPVSCLRGSFSHRRRRRDPTSLLSVTSTLDSPRPALASPTTGLPLSCSQPPYFSTSSLSPSSITLSSSDSHRGQSAKEQN